MQAEQSNVTVVQSVRSIGIGASIRLYRTGRDVDIIDAVVPLAHVRVERQPRLAGAGDQDRSIPILAHVHRKRVG